MEIKKILKRDNSTVIELYGTVTKNYKGLELNYTEVYYLDCEVSEESGIVNKSKQVKHYTMSQIERNMSSLKTAYLIAKGSVSPIEIISFRNKHKIAASTLSLILGFSKNTISNIENDGVSSLASGRLIKMCLNNSTILKEYIQLCDSIDKAKKQAFSESLFH